MNCKLASYILHTLLLASLTSTALMAQYEQPQHRPLPDGAIPVTGPGSYDRAGSTYMLQNDIHGERSSIFLGKDVTLDLNGYTITYEDGNYQHVKNYGFEEGLKGWDVSKAPGAKIEKAHDATIDFLPFRTRSDEQPDYLATGTMFLSNEFKGLEFGIDATDQQHSYTVYWTLTINLHDKSGNNLINRDIVIMDKNIKAVLHQDTDSH